MRYNEVIETEIVTDLATEPVTLEEAKAHMNMLFETSGSYVFTDDDDYITGLITAARQALEQYTGLSFGAKDLVVVVRNECGGQPIPFGPITEIESIVDREGEEITSDDYQLSGRQFKTIDCPRSEYLVVTYSAGYTVLPAPLKTAILHQVQYLYDNRGSQERLFLCQSALELASPYKRTSFLV